MSVEDISSVQCSSSYALCWWWHSRERGGFFFAQLYKKMIQEQCFFLYCTVCYKNGNETGPDLVIIVDVLSYAIFTGFQMALFNGSTTNKIFSRQSHCSPSL